MKELAPVGGRTKAWGIITAPNHKGIPADIKAGKPWAADLGCLQGPDFVKRIDISAVAEWLPKMLPYRQKCLFLAGGDIVGDAESTLETYTEFEHYFSDWPLAYIAQNGAEVLPIPESCAAVFIAGVPIPGRILRNGKEMDWKDSPEAVEVIRRAQAMGKHIHIGRVNWHRRFKIFQVLNGYEKFTFDGTRTRFDGTEKTIKAWQEYQLQPPLITI